MELVIYTPQEGDFIREISFNHEEIMQELAVRLEKYNGLVYSERNIKDAKADRATLNKFKEAIEARRKEIKKQCLEPYNDFEAKVKEIVAMIDKPILAIDTQVKAYEQIKKDEKLEGIKAFYTDKVGDLDKLIPFDKVYNPKWMNATYKEKDIQQEIQDLFIKVEDDLKAITELQTEYELQIKDVYLKNFDLTAALQEKKRLEEQAAKLAEHKRLQEEKARQRQAQADEVKQCAMAPASTPEPPPEPEAPEPSREVLTPTIEPEKLHEIEFRVRATIPQLKALKQFFVDNEIIFERVND